MFNLDGIKLIEYIGRGHNYPELVDFLESAEIFDKPFPPHEDYSFLEEPEISWSHSRDSKIIEIERYGICLIYEDSEAYNIIYDKAESDLFTLKEIVFYSTDTQKYKGYKGYEGDLPSGLLFSISRDKIRKNELIQYITTRTIEESEVDLFYTDGFIINISFSSLNKIEMLHVRKPHAYDLDMLGIKKEYYTNNNYDATRFINLLGKSIYNKELINLITQFPLYENNHISESCNHTETFDFTKEHGLRLHFDCADNFNGMTCDNDDSGVILSGIQVVRKGEYLSTGYNGKNLYDIKFSFLKEEVIKAVGRDPDITSNINIYTILIWKESSYILHVLVNLLDCQVEQISYIGSFVKNYFHSDTR